MTEERKGRIAAWSIICLTFIIVGLIPFLMGAGSLPIDNNRNAIQGLAPSIPFQLQEKTKGYAEFDVSRSAIVRYKATAATTYNFDNNGAGWPVEANTDEIVAVPPEAVKLRVFVNVSSATATKVYVQQR